VTTFAPSGDDLSGVAVLSQTLHRLGEAHRRFRAHIAKDASLSATEIDTLLLIADTPGISPRARSSDLGITTGAVTALLDQLERAGYTSRVPNLTDRRGLEIRLTDAGRYTLASMRDAYRTTHPLGNITTAPNAASRNQHPTTN
jgi:DNA-binding MarR family transcriptional regulator